MKKVILPHFGLILKATREEIGMTQQRLADLAAIERNYVYYLESGRADPSLTVLRNLASALGMTFTEFATKIDQAFSQTNPV